MYVVRHGETIWNRARRVQGHRDSPLTQRGLAQAHAVGRRLQDRLVNSATATIRCSPLGRAWQTAAIIAETLGRDPNDTDLDEALKEMTWGAWDGMTRTEIERDYPGALARRGECKWDYQIPDGESYGGLARRLAHWLEGQSASPNTVVVAHGAVIRMLRGLYGEMSEDEILLLDEPQDAFFYFEAGRIERIEVT